MIPERWRYLMMLNPVTVPIEAIRYVFLGQGTVDFPGLTLSVIVSAIIFFSGLLIFQKVERSFVDTI